MAGTNGPLRFRGHVEIGGELECLSGLHIGGNRDALCLSGVDHPVLRDAATGAPIVPGSSLKGRMRALLEILRGRVRYDRADTVAADGPDAIDLLFGTRGGPKRFGPTRLVVRDAVPLAHGRDRETLDWWEALDTDGLGTEIKAETTVNRVTAAAWPRQIERVVAGSRFEVRFVLQVYDFLEDEERLLKDVLVGLSLIEDSYLGGHGSRGYGRVRFRLHEQQAVVRASDYEAGRKRVEPAGELKTLDQIDGDAWVERARERLGDPA